MAERKSVRCAIYTRKSTEFGLEQDFNSLDAQREACEAYIKSQAHEGWKLLPAKYDDGGTSGATLDRAAIQTLLEDVKARKIDVIVVYKVDRLTRSLADFAKLVELFDAHDVSFVSVTQQFNTTSSMGRLTLNVLLSFAQFEREVTAERIRDKIAASRQKGIWMGGSVPLGYTVADRKLQVDETEAEQVRFIFRRYLEMPSVLALRNDLEDRGYLTKRRVLSKGKTVGGIPFYKGPLAYLLKNRVYIGESRHGDKHYPGQHSPIIDRELFDAVQAKIAASAVTHKNVRAASEAILMGKIYDDAGNRMSPVSTQKGTIRYRFYVSSALTIKSKKTAGSVKRISASPLEAAVVDALRARFPIDEGSVPTQQLENLGERPCTTAERQLVQKHVEQVTLSANSLLITLKPNATDPETGVGVTRAEMIVIPFKPKRGRPRRDILHASDTESDAHSGVRADTRQVLLRGIAKARDWASELAEGRTPSVEVIAAREDFTPRYVRQILPLAFLAPDIIAAVLANTIPANLGISRLIDGLPYSWKQQRQKLRC